VIAVGISDIRVSFADGRACDCLQKIYPVGRFIPAGFSGSVRFGFWTIEDQRSWLELPPSQDAAWIPGWVAFKWRRRARHAFADAPAEERALGSRIMLSGVSPTVDIGLPGIALPTVAVLRSPDFVPQILKVNEVATIGSGADVDVYMSKLRETTRLESEVWRMEVAAPGASAQILRYLVSLTLDEHPTMSVPTCTYAWSVEAKSHTTEQRPRDCLLRWTPRRDTNAGRHPRGSRPGAS